MSDVTLRMILLGEDRSASKSMKHVGESAKGMMASTGSQIARMGSMIGGEVGELMDRVSEGFEKAGEKGAGLGTKMAAVGAVATGLGVAMQSMASSDIAAHQQLMAAVDATGKGYEKFGEDVEGAISHQEHFGHTAVDTQEALRVLTQAYQDPKKALAEMNLVSDIAAAKHMNLAAAANVVAKAHGGSARIFKEFGLSLAGSVNPANDLTKAEKAHTAAADNLTKAQRALQQLEERDHAKKKLTIADHQALENAQRKVVDAQSKLGASSKTLQAAQQAMKDGTTKADAALNVLAGRLRGQAAAASDTFSGKLNALRAKVQDGAAAFATKFGPAVTAAGPLLMGLGVVVDLASKANLVLRIQLLGVAIAEKARAVATVASTVATKAAAAGQWLLNAALDANPIGIVVIALAALAAAVIWAYKNVGWFRAAVDTGFHAIASMATWLWNNIFAPVIRFLLNGFANVAGAIGHVLQALGNIPGFGWAKKAGDMMVGAANAARSLANNINNINDKTVTVTVDFAAKNSMTGPAASAAQQAAFAGRHFARGGTNIPAGFALVGEHGPEVVYLPGGSSVYNAQQSAAMLSGRGSGVAAGGDTFQVMVPPGTTRQQAMDLLAEFKRLKRGGVSLGLA